MSAPDVSTPAGLGKLNGLLNNSSYIAGFVPSGKDVETFKKIDSKKVTGTYPHVARWYRHIASYTQDERSKWAGAPAAAAASKDDEDDDVDLFGSDEEEVESAEKIRIREERLKAYNEKKSKKPTIIAKTSVLLDVKPWDDETDMAAMTKQVKSIEMDGLLWGADKLVPIGYGIKKLTVMCTVVDDKVSIEELQEKIEAMEDFVQSCDVAAMNKI
ncbi:elongation factor 1-beta [Lepeophtheirus salmonis]|uniref:elongation factor 1-beta n=1 Tax=Lepeophtheirus salmonis TaxID=72036 RepID=UPI001AEA5F53|nr:elongation factor 1-beta'-like [Lepeophtheirus salmonis]